MSIANVRPETGVRAEGLGYIEVTDMFCGAGGSSLGLEHVPGLLVTQCINHDALCIEAHNKNFPHADHDYQDIWATPASRFRRTPFLWASPSCTHHAYCRGPKSQDEDSQKSRATMWCVCRFTEHHGYDAIVVENVVEARLWCEDHEKCGCGSTFNKWFQTMIDLGYEGQIVYFNSQFALPTPQSRDRMYVVFWRKGVRKPDLDFRPVSWCSSCETVVRGIQTWKKASKGGTRSKPGMFEWGRYGSQYTYNCPQCAEMVAPAVVGSRSIIDFADAGTRIADRPRPLKPNTRKRIRIGLQRLATTDPVTVQVGGHLYERQGYARVWSVNDPMRALTTTNYTALVVPNKDSCVPSSADEPAGTVTTRQHLAMVVPNMNHNVPREIDEPLGAATTGNRHLLVQVNRGGKGASDASRNRDVHQPMPTISGHGEVAIVALRKNGAPCLADEPAPTVAASGNHHGLLVRAGGQSPAAKTNGEPMMTITAHDRQIGMLVYNGNPGFVRSLEDAAGTVTARDKQSLLIPYYNTGVAYPTAEPMHTVTSKDRHALVISEDDIDECFFRMLRWPELLKAQQMHVMPDGSDYLLEARRKDRYGKLKGLSDEQRVRMIGNAVSSPVATMIGTAVVDALR